MNKLIPVFFLILTSAGVQAIAQAPFATMDSVYINNINAGVMVQGNMWRNPVTHKPHSNFPADSASYICFYGALWMSGYDAANNLHLAGETYNDTFFDYWPGPLDGSDTLTYATAENWAKIWKVNRPDIQYFQGLATHTIANTPPPILTWPAKGNVYAQGNSGVALTITNDMAPFVDLNGNGIYEPLLGEYPDVPGDQALWWVFSDNGPSHAASSGKPLGVEIHAMAYGYDRGTLINNVIYYEYNIVNRSPNTYTDFRFSQWNDPDIGWYLDDYLGFDSLHRMGIAYCGTNDDGAGGGHPVGSYDLNPPMAAVTMIVLPGDVGTSYVPAGCFDYFNDDNSIIGIPQVDTEYNNYMRSKLRNGQHFRDDFMGRGIPSSGAGTGPDCNYVFPGDPSDTSQWNECACNNNPGDRRYVLTSNDFTLPAGGTQKIVMALIAVGHGGGCPVASFDSIKIVADTAWANYFNPPPPIPAGLHNVSANNGIKVYPNPANEVLFIENTGISAGAATVTVYNTLGQAIDIAISKNGPRYEAGIGRLPVGLYYVQYRDGSVLANVQFVKE